MTVSRSRSTLLAMMGTPMRAADVPQGKAATNSGRWITYSGDEIQLAIDGLSRVDKDKNLEPIRVVVDLATLTAQAPTILALNNHDRSQPMGSWQDIDIDVARGVTMSLTLAEPSAPTSLVYVREVRDLLAAKAPLQASIGAIPGPKGYWELIAPGETVTVNGQTFTAGAADSDAPLYILRGGELFETSVVPFGADPHTGRLAAAASKEPAMSAPAATATPAPGRLGALLAKATKPEHKVLIAEAFAAGKTDDEIVLQLSAAAKAEDDEALAKATKMCAQLTADLEAEKAAHNATKAAHAAEMVKLTAEAAKARGTLEAAHAGVDKPLVTTAPDAEKSGEQPETLTAAIRAAMGKDKTLKASEARLQALKRWPNIPRL